MASTITLYTPNILEDGTVTVTGTADTGYPEARLWDRSISLFWKDTATAAQVYHVDQGASGAIAIDFLAIPKHNWNGEDIQWQWSTNDAAWNDFATDWTQGDNVQIIKTKTALAAKRYWRVTVTSMSNPKASEIFMSKGYTFTVNANPEPTFLDVDNVQWNRSVGGIERSTKFGDKRRTRSYSLFLDSTDKTNFRVAMAYLDHYTKPFYIRDHEDNYFMCRLQSISPESYDQSSHVIYNIQVIEEL